MVMSKRGMVAFWKYTEKNFKCIDRLQLVFADGTYSYDKNDRSNLLDIARIAVKYGEMAEVRVSRERVVTFIINMNRNFDLDSLLNNINTEKSC